MFRLDCIIYFYIVYITAHFDVFMYDYERAIGLSINIQSINQKGIGLNKLRTYKLFKTEYKVEEYVIKVKAVNQRSAMSRFRCGVAPITLEIGRFFNIPANERFSNFCSDQVEDESHVILLCPLYNKIREELFIHASYISDDFMQMSGTEKIVFLFSDSNRDVPRPAILF